SPLVEQISFANTGAVRMVTTKQYDFLNRLTNITSTTNSVPFASFAYLYNTADQRTAVTNVDGCFWLYGYDPLAQFTSGTNCWPDGTPVAGQQFEYAFDNIGNRTSTKSGGNSSGFQLRTATYSPNGLNEYTSREAPGYSDVLGAANTNAAVTLWTDAGYWGQT